MIAYGSSAMLVAPKPTAYHPSLGPRSLIIAKLVAGFNSKSKVTFTSLNVVTPRLTKELGTCGESTGDCVPTGPVIVGNGVGNSVLVGACGEAVEPTEEDETVVDDAAIDPTFDPIFGPVDEGAPVVASGGATCEEVAVVDTPVDAVVEPPAVEPRACVVVERSPSGCNIVEVVMLVESLVVLAI